MRRRVAATAISLGVLNAIAQPLSLNIAAPVFTGPDPGVLPASGLNQAEPHITRDPRDPDRLLAVFQDGRYADGGAVNNGFAVSLDGGFSWRRETFPGLALVSGGPYTRATDPVAGIDRSGRFYANALVSVSGVFNESAVVVQWSDDDGETWSAPVEVYRGTTTISPDKNWMAINQDPAAASAGRLLVTWSDFATVNGETRSIRLKRAWSDDRGATWSAADDLAPVDVPAPFYQGTQPLFPRGDWCVVVYHHFTSIGENLDGAVEMAVSADGGATFSPVPETILANYRPNPDTNVRNGAFLPTATASADNGDIHVAVLAPWPAPGGPRRIVYFRTDAAYAKSGVSWNWREPVALPGDPDALSLYTPTLSVDPTGQNVAIFYYARTSGTRFLPPVLLEPRVRQSQDGGLTWGDPQPLLDGTVEASLGTLTSRGYMLGDYYGFAGPTAGDPAGLVVWMNDRDGQIDPIASRVATRSLPRWTQWQSVQFGLAERRAGFARPETDFDNDQLPNLLEASLRLHPAEPDPLPESSTRLDLLASGDDWQVELRSGDPWLDAGTAPTINPIQTGGDWHSGFPDIPDWFVTANLEEDASHSPPFILSGPAFPWRVLSAAQDNWWRSPWFGWINAAGHPWLYSPAKGHLFRGPGSASGVWLYLPADGWIWINRKASPYAYSTRASTWYRFFP